LRFYYKKKLNSFFSGYTYWTILW